METQWTPVKGYPDYEMSGSIIRHKETKKLVVRKKGIVTLSKDGKEHQVDVKDLGIGTATPAPEKPAAEKGKGKGKEKTPAKPKEKKEKKVGVIDTIQKLITEATRPGISKEDILKGLKKAFPQKAADSMKNTINAQLGSKSPTRMEKERKLKFDNTVKEDVVFYYLKK